MPSETKTDLAPEILNAQPQPEPELKSFHRKKLQVWSGKVKVDRVHGWVRNRRIDLFVRDFEEKFSREPTSQEIYEHMRSEEKEYQLRALAKSIAYNGMRIPIILDADGTLLDGNRRYFSTLLAIENRLAPAEELENIPAWVLFPTATDEDKRSVLIETNFLPDYKRAWPDYIKALVMYEDHYDRHMTWEKLVERYGVDKGRIRSMVMAMDLIQEFVAHFHDPEDPGNTERAEVAAYENFTLFEEAHNKLRGQLDTDADFKEQFFQWMFDDKFKSITEIRRLGDIRNDEEAWDTIRENRPDAVKWAIHIVDEKKLPDSQDGERKISRVVRTLRDLKEWEIASISRDTMMQLRQVLMDVTAMAQAVNIQKQSTTDADESIESAANKD